MRCEPDTKSPGAGLSIIRLRRQMAYDRETGDMHWLLPRGSTAAGAAVRPWPRKNGHLYLKFDGKIYAITTIIYALMTDEMPNGHLRFVDRNPTNLRWSNIERL